MKNSLKGKVATTIILLATFILAGVAIFTAIRLYQLRQTSVAPNVPSSLPKAAENTCSLSFTLTVPSPTPTPTSGLICEKKSAWLDNSRNIPHSYQLITLIPAGSNITSGQRFVYTLTYKNTGKTTVNSVTFTDTLPTQVDFVDADNNCTYNSSTRTVTCNLNNVVAGGASQKAIRVKTSTTAPPGSFTNTASLQGTGVSSSQCQIALNLQTSTPTPTPTPTATPTATATPTPVPQCDNTCTQNGSCPSNLTCYITSGTTGNCRNTSCTGEASCICATSTPTPTPTSTSGVPNSCGGTCGSNSNCSSGLVCSGGYCRNPNCTSDTDCVCPTSPTSTPNGTSNPTATPTAPALPQSGTDWPSIFGIGVGIITIIGSLLLAL